MDVLDIKNDTSVSDDDEMKVEINEIDESDNLIKDSIMCDECPVIVSNNDKLLIHKKKKHMRLICGQCGYVIFGKDKLDSHVKNHRSEVCSYCGVVVKNKCLKRHMEMD